MTDVGKIKFGVEVDADNLSAKLGEAVRKAIAPALARIQKDLQKVQREYDKTAKASTKAAVTQVANAEAVEVALRRVAAAQGALTDQMRQYDQTTSRTTQSTDRNTESTKRNTRSKDQMSKAARAVAEAQAEVNAAMDVFGRRSPEAARAHTRLSRAEAAHTSELLRAAAASKGGTDSQIRDYQRLAREAEMSAARQAAAHAAAAAGSGGGGGGGGSPGYRGGSGVMRFLTSPVGLGAISLAAQSLPALATGVTNVVGAVQQLIQGGLALPAIFAAGAASIATVVVGFKGIGEATKAMNDALKSGKSADLEKAKEAMKDLSPAGVALAETLAKLNRGPLLEFRKNIQGRMLDGFAGDLQALSDKALPRAEAGMGKMADAWRGTLKQITGTLGSDQNLSLMDQIFGNSAEGQKRANAAIQPLVTGMMKLTAEGSKFLPRLGDAITSVSERFDRWVTKNVDNGNMFRWIDEGFNGLRAFGNALLNIIQTITGLTKAAGQLNGSLSGDGGFLGWLEDATGRMNRFVNSTEGQGKLGDFFRNGRADMETWGRVLSEVGKAIGHIIEGFQVWGEVLLPILGALAHVVDALGEIPGLLEAVVVGFLAWRTLGPIIGGLTSKLTAMGTAVGATGMAAGTPGNRALNRGLTGAALIGTGTMIQQTADKQDIGSQVLGGLSSVAGGALTGAAIGSVIPGIGTAVGAGAGAAVGAAIAGINYLLADNQAAQDAAATATERLSAANARSAEAMAVNAQAIKSVNDALAESGGTIDAATLAGVGDQINNITERLSGAYDEDTLKGIAAALGDVGMTTDQMAGTITGSQAQFDALTARLNDMGPAGQIAAAQLASIRDATLGAANNATTAAPLLSALSEQFGGIAEAGVAVQNAFAAIPADVPINVNAPGGQAVFDILKSIGEQITTNADGTINVQAPLADSTLQQLRALGVQISENRDGTIVVQLDEQKYIDTFQKLGTLGEMYQNLFANSGTLPVPSVPAGPPRTTLPEGSDPFAIPGPRPRATGGAIWGGVPGKDSVPSLLMPGEHVLTTADVAAMGGQAGVYAFRNALHFADGGAVGHLGTGALPGPVNPDTELGVLIQIRDLLAGKGGPGSNPLAATAANTATSATATKGATGGMGPFGTPLKKRGDPGYEMAAAAISALGGDPEKWIGMDPSTYVPPGMGGYGLPGVMGAGLPVNYAAQAAALAAFARSGDLADVSGLGLNANDPVITALVSARNKKKNGLSDDEIAGLVDQVLGQGGYGGVLDDRNTSVIKSLTRYREQLMKQQGLDPNASTRGAATTAASVGVPLTQLPTGAMDPISAYAAAHSGGQYEWGASDLAKGLSDCSGAVSDLVEIITKGQTDPGRLFNAGPGTRDALTKLGAVEGAIPGALQIGWDNTHMRSTLPNGVNFESGGQTGQGATYGGAARGAAGMANIMSIPISGLPMGAGFTGTGLPGAAGGSGTPVYVTNWPGQGNMPPGLNQILGAGLGAAGGAAGTVATDILGALTARRGGGGPTASLDQLLDERNPMALASALGFDVQDFTRTAGSGSDIERNGQQFDASGRLISDTGGLTDRTFTDLQAQLKAMREQLVDVIEQTNEKLSDTVLEPVIKAGMQNALESLKDSVSQAIGTSLGNAAAPPIADAVGNAVASSMPAAPVAAGNSTGLTVPLPGLASGGPISGGTPGKDSVPALLMPGEYVLNTSQVARMGGFSGVEAVAAKGMRRYARGGGVVNNDVVGAEFFGVGEVPILGAIINLIISLLLKVVGIEIQSRDTMTELTDEFRGFRGDAFKAFDATGRLMNDTSSMMDRTATSTEAAAEERIRILKMVIEAVIKYIIEKVVVPIGKAVANAAIQAGASAAGAAVNTQAPGAGGLVSSLISSGGQAGVEIVAEIGSDFAVALTGVLTDVIADGIQGAAPGLVNSLFGGGLLAGLFDPAGGLLNALFGGITGTLGGIFGALFGGLSTLIPGIPFDNGGLARGKGLMLKDVNADELVLNPGETDLFVRFVRALENGGFGGTNSTHVSAPITIVGGGRETADQVENRLLKLMPS